MRLTTDMKSAGGRSKSYNQPPKEGISRLLNSRARNLALATVLCAGFCLNSATTLASDQTGNKKKTAANNAAKTNSKGKSTNATKSKLAASKAPLAPTHLPPYKPKAEPARTTASTKQKEASPFVTLPNYLHTISLSTGPGAPRLDETVGLGLESHFILVPLDFVLTAWLTRSDLHFYVNESGEAHLVDLDLAGNLALLKADQPLSATLPRTQIRTTLPTSNELLAYVDGKTSMRGGPRFISLIRDDDNIRYDILASSDLKSGGFLFDHNAKLVSVVPAYARYTLNDSAHTWTSSTQAIFEILHHQDTPKPASSAGLEDRHRQLMVWQERWAQSLVPARQMIGTQKIDCHNGSGTIADPSVASQIRQMNAMDCQAKTMIPLGVNYAAGFELKTGNLVLRQTGLSDEKTLQLATSFASDYFDDLDQNSKKVNLLTTETCSSNKVTNQQGRNVEVKFCTSALKPDQGLNDTVIAVSSVDSGSHAYVVAAHLKGFDQNNTKKVMEALIENGGSLK